MTVSRAQRQATVQRQPMAPIKHLMKIGMCDA